MTSDEFKMIVASDVSTRNGIGIEIYVKNELIVEIFRDDTKKTREVILYQKGVPLDLVEKSIEIFRKEIPWDFVNGNETQQDT